MATTNLIFSDGHEVYFGQPSYFPTYTLRAGDQCKIKLDEYQQYAYAEFTGIYHSGETYVKIDGINRKVALTDILPSREIEEQNYLSPHSSYDMFGNKRVNTSIQPGIYTLMQLIAASSKSF